MIRINLLPHREEAKRARREQFFVASGIVALIGVLVVLLVYSLIDRSIGDQTARNDYLKREIAVLDKQLDEIKRLKEQTQALIARKQIIENLQRDRGETVHLLNELAKQVPEGVYIKSLKQEGLKVTIVGFAQSNARVSYLMSNIEASPWLENPQLIETKAVKVNGRRSNEFSMSFSLKRTQSEGGEKK